MPPAAQPFPAFDDWKRMSEHEQDAWLDRLEQSKRRGRVAIPLLIGFALTTVSAVAVASLLLGVR